MSHIRAHRLLSVAMQRLERGEKVKDILHAIKGAAETLQDPFAGEIDEFLKEKQSGGGGGDYSDGEGSELASDDPNEKYREEDSRVDIDAPQEEAEDKLEEETPPQDQLPGDEEQDAPQEEAEDRLEEEQEEADDEKVDELEKRKQDIQQEIDKVQRQNEEYAESTLKKIAAIAKQRGYLSIANQLYKISAGGVVEILNNLLMKEYLQRDVAVNYYYLFDASYNNYLKEHFDSEKERVAYLQKAIVQLGATPTTQRLSIPPVNPLSCEGVIALITELEKQAVAEYIAAAKSLEDMPEYMTLKSWLLGIATDEAEDVQEMESR